MFPESSQFQSGVRRLDLEAQCGDTYFAQSHLLFLRYFLLHRFSSAEVILKIENLIKEKLFEECAPEDLSLIHFAKRSLAIKSYLSIFAENPRTFAEITRDLPGMPHTACAHSFNFNNEINQALQMHMPVSKSNRKQNAKIRRGLIKSVTLEIERNLYTRSLESIHENLEELMRSSSSISSSKMHNSIVNYIRLKHDKELELKNIFIERSYATLELIEESFQWPCCVNSCG